MKTEHSIICGGMKTAGIRLPGERMSLNLWPGEGRTQNVRLQIEDLHDRICQAVAPQFHDMIEIAAYVYSADQMASRGGKDVDTFGANWRRHFHFHVPVRVPEFWSAPEVVVLLREVLEFLSDDYYDFTFYRAEGAPGIQLYLGLDEKGAVRFDAEQVMLFSGGLDSLSGAIEEAVVQKRRIVLVNHLSTDKFGVKHRELVRRLVEKAGAAAPLHLRVRISKVGVEGKEHTQRARSFLYGSVGATVSMMLGLRRVRFYENGVVSLNLPVCAQVVGSRSTRTTHPRVLAGMQKLLSKLAGEPFMVDNPFLWETKGDVVGRLLRNDCGPMIELSRSCAHTWETSNEHTHCGVCSQCIDRRFAVLAALAEEFDPIRQYKLDIFTQSRPKDEDKIMLAAYLERANRVKELRDAADLLEAFPEVRRVLPYLGLDAGRGADRVLDLYRRHAGEVNAGVDIMLARYARALRERTLPGDCLLWTVYGPNSVNVLPVGGAATPPPEEGGVNGQKFRHRFRQAGDYWDVVFDGKKPFHLKDTLGAKYLDYLVHHPSEPISAYDLEMNIRPDKAKARPKDSVHDNLDADAVRYYLRQLNKLRSDREKASEDGDWAKVDKLDGDIEAIESELKNNGQAPDAGERSRGNVSKAIAAVQRRLRKGGENEKALAEHIEQFISMGYECCYNQPQENRWG